MICQHFIHIGLGDTGEGMVRAAVQGNLFKKGRIVYIDSRAHLPLWMAKEILDEHGWKGPYPPMITGVRNPWDWRISFYVHWLRALRHQGTFGDFCRDLDLGHFKKQRGVNMTQYWRYHGCDEAAFVIRFENFKEDMAMAFSDVLGLVTRDEVLTGWFPKVYEQWAGPGHAWLENIEQNMRFELYKANPGLADLVYEQDRELIEKFGYSFDDYYEPPVVPPGLKVDLDAFSKRCAIFCKPRGV